MILGVGLDCRAYRTPGIEGTRVFEVDLPAPQRLKQERLQHAFGKLQTHVTYVPIDFNRQSLGDELTAAGFETGARTFFVWEGATQYITAEAVDATFRCVACAAAAGSEIAFT